MPGAESGVFARRGIGSAVTSFMSIQTRRKRTSFSGQTSKLFDAAVFAGRVRDVVRSIPAGEVMTYGAIAKAIGAPRHARQVAKVMSQNYLPDVPCHRVIRSDGTLGGYNRGGVEVKQDLLTQEGYTINKY